MSVREKRYPLEDLQFYPKSTKIQPNIIRILKDTPNNRET